jgi:argininosuccinate lyase
MATQSETTKITRALLALATAVDEIQMALGQLAPAQSQQFQHHVKASREAMGQCLEDIHALLVQMDRAGE